ncbi:MAG: HAMP domain-containing sensor histidine kinase [Anaerolineae bacterium]|jgi:signal transduction histidine kinase
MRRSIRWELPLSYAAIALLAAVALGAVLLFILGDHYTQLEREYLESNAQTLAFALSQLVESDPPVEELQASLVSLSFLSQARVRLLDEAGQEVADSDSPERFAVALAALPGRDVVPPGARSETGSNPETIIAISPRIPDSEAITRTRTLGQRIVGSLPDSDEVIVLPAQPVVPGAYILRPGGQDLFAGPRSSQVVRLPIYDHTSAQLVGYVELSEGPAYGQQIVTSVARGWILAGAVAVALAAAAGWLISRRISRPLSALTGVTASMAEGDLTARADVSRRDEFGALARSFNRMADQVEGTVTTLGQFVSDAAHQLRTPLTALQTSLELAPQDEHVAQAQAQMQRLEALTGGLLDLSRIESDAEGSETAPLPLKTLVTEVSELYASQAEQAGLGFELSLPEAPLVIRGDGAQLRQALANLLDNAIKFTPAGGRVCLGLGREGEMAVLWVEDTGIGIPPDELPRLFQRFHRGRNASAYPGSGLGLAIVRAIAERHGGRVQGESTESGTRVSLWLPV